MIVFKAQYKTTTTKMHLILLTIIFVLQLITIVLTQNIIPLPVGTNNNVIHQRIIVPEYIQNTVTYTDTIQSQSTNQPIINGPIYNTLPTQIVQQPNIVAQPIIEPITIHQTYTT